MVLQLLRVLQAFEYPLAAHYKTASDFDQSCLDKIWGDCGALAGHILLAERNGIPIGLASVLTAIEMSGDEEEYAHTLAHIGELVVVENARGLGVGRALINACEKLAKEAGRKEITIGVLAQNLNAKKLYNTCGYADAKIRLRKPLA